MKGFIVYPDYTIINDQTYVQLFGRLENGQSFVALNKLEPYFFVEEADLKKLLLLLKKYKVEKTNLTNFKGNENVKIRIEGNFFRASSADMIGRQVLDGLSLIKDPFIKEAPSIKHAEFESWTLEDVSQVILGSGKIIKGSQRHEEISELYKKDQQKLADYNLLDCELAYKIVEKTGVIDLAVERSQLTGMPLDRITSSIASFDSLYIREARIKS